MICLQKSDLHDGTLNQLAPDLTPMLDILFILLVFFMLTAGTVLHSIDLVLPSSVAEKLSIVNVPKHIMLEIRQENYALDGKQINEFEQLKQWLQKTIEEKPAHKLIIAGDKNISIEQLLNVLTYLQSQEIEAANILLQNEDNI